LTAEDLYEFVSLAIEKVDYWPEDYTRRWVDLRESILALLQLDVAAVEAKGHELLAPNGIPGSSG
jgi:hypothetical protein